MSKTQIDCPDCADMRACMDMAYEARRHLDGIAERPPGPICKRCGSTGRIEVDVEKAVDDLLAKHGITYSVKLRGEKTRDGWKCDAWDCAFTNASRPNEPEDFDYFTGTGHRRYLVSPYGPAKFRPAGWRPTVKEAGSPRTLYREDYDRRHLRPFAPSAAGVLHSLLLDSSAVGQSFESWADEYGYDTDSRKAEQTYRDCQRNADKLARVIPHAVRESLAELLQDY